MIPFEPLWGQYNRVIKSNGAICLFGSEPFSTALRASNLRMYRYDWIWEKTVASNFALCKKQPFKKHEIISVFYCKQPTYNPQFEIGKPYDDVRKGNYRKNISVGDGNKLIRTPIHNSGTRYPSSVLKFSNGNNRNVHPTQKPTPLLEYLIKTYTNEGGTVLDNAAGSMSTVIACINTNRNCIAIEKDEHYFSVGCKRVHDHIPENNIDLCYNQVCGGVCLWQSSKTEQVKDMVGF